MYHMRSPMARKLKRHFIFYFISFHILEANLSSIYGALISTEYIRMRMVKAWMALLLFFDILLSVGDLQKY